jgi:GNAT superfamily N-acetyltransferase
VDVTRSSTEGGAATRARAWYHAAHAAVCDVLEPWAHGTVVRATRYPSYYDLNVVRVEEDPAMSVEALAAFADEALAGLAHRRVDFDLASVAEPLRAGFEANAWKPQRLLWMRHQAPPPPGPDVPVEEVPYDAVHDLRVAWHQEESPDQDPGNYHAQAREVSLRRDAQVLAVREGGEPVAFAQLERHGEAAEITQVYVHPEHRGGGRGTAMTRAAIEAAGDVRDLWIVADDDDRPKELYARLGFRPAVTSMQFLRPPVREEHRGLRPPKVS